MLKSTLIAAFFAAQLALFGSLVGFTAPKAGEQSTVKQGTYPLCYPDECCWDGSCEDEGDD